MPAPKVPTEGFGESRGHPFSLRVPRRHASDAAALSGRAEVPQDEFPVRLVDEQTRLKSTNQMDVLRAVSSAFSLASKPFRITCGLLGALSSFASANRFS